MDNCVDNFQLIKTTFPYYWVKKTSHSHPQTPLVYIHGFGDTPKIMMPLLQEITDRDIYCIELPGHFETPCEHKKELKPFIFARQIEQWLDHLQLKEVHLMGHSMGGGISLMVAHNLPTVVKKLILISPMNHKGCGPKEVFNIVFRFTPANDKKARAFWKILLNPAHIDIWHEKYSPSLIENYHARKHNYTKLGLSLASATNMHHLKRAEKNIQAQTLLLVGQYDGCISARRTSKFLKKRIPQITVQHFAHSGHICFNEEPHLFLQTLKDFLA